MGITWIDERYDVRVRNKGSFLGVLDGHVVAGKE